jgi:anti-sigma B factor antagonist
MSATKATVSLLKGDVALIKVNGSMLGDEETAGFRQAIAACIAERHSRLLIDLDGVKYMNSTAIGVLVSALASYTRRQWELKLCGANKVVNSILTITKLNLIFDTSETRTDALAKFSG